jgi:hypothetical protein
MPIFHHVSLCTVSVSSLDGHICAAVRLLKGVARYRRNPYGRLNLGIIDIETPYAGADSKLYGHQGDEPICVYRSPEI